MEETLSVGTTYKVYDTLQNGKLIYNYATYKGNNTFDNVYNPDKPVEFKLPNLNNYTFSRSRERVPKKEIKKKKK